jgi:hypothetical protein
MSDIKNEYESAIKLVVEKYKDLEKLNPQHKLLKLIKDVGDNGFTGTKKFLKRYDEKREKDRLHHYIDVHMNYYLNLDAAVIGELEKIIRKEKKKLLKSREKKKYDEVLRKIMEEKGLVKAVKTL